MAAVHDGGIGERKQLALDAPHQRDPDRAISARVRAPELRAAPARGGVLAQPQARSFARSNVGAFGRRLVDDEITVLPARPFGDRQAPQKPTAAFPFPRSAARY